MNPPDRAPDALRAAGHLAAALAARAQDALPRLRDLEREVSGAWRDAAGQAWTERSSLVRRALERELDAALAAERGARALLDAFTPEPAPTGPDGAGPGPGAMGGGAVGRTDRGRGARLGGTEADRADTEPGMRLGTLDG